MGGATSKAVCKAIAMRRVCRFVYSGIARTVEIYCHGTARSGKELIRAYELVPTGAANKWKLFDVAKMIDFTVSETEFVRRADYRPRDPAIPIVCCGIDRVPTAA